MKTFVQLREQTVFKKKINRIQVEVKKQGNKFVAIVDGDKLDSYKTQKEAEKMAQEFVKQYKG